MPPERDGGFGSRAPLVHKPDAALAAVIIVIAAGLFYLTTGFEQVPDLLSQNVGPEKFPRLVLTAFVLLALGLPIEHRFVRGGRERLDSDRRRPIGTRTWLTAGLLVLIGALMPYAGTLLSLVLVCLLLPPLWGDFRPRVVVPFAIVFPLIVKLVFEDLLKVSFEPGLLAFLVD